MKNTYMIFLDDERQYNNHMPYELMKKNNKHILTPEIYKDMQKIYPEGETYILVKSYSEFLECILNNYNSPDKFLPDFISLDHDLADEHYRYSNSNDIPYYKFINPSGWHCLKWFLNFLSENKLNKPVIVCHSFNEQGKKNIKKLLREYKDANRIINI